MKVNSNKILVMTLIASSLATSSIAWADEAVLNQRIDRLERIIKGQGLVSLLGRVDQLQNEIQRLNGENESLNHKIEGMQKRQRDLYIDIDQRLVDLAQRPATLTTTQTEIVEGVETVVEPVKPETTAPQLEQIDVNKPQEQLTTPVAVENGEAAYQAALQTLRRGQYEQAITALSAFPEQYPGSNYLPNTYYWQGEANYVLRNFDLAVRAFRTVIDRYPASTKVADATLKLGFSQYELGQVELATTTLNNVLSTYPDTSVARLAKVRLDKIKQANR